jgi:hypothetical protein
LHIIEDIEMIILKKENKEKGSLRNAKYTNWPLIHTGTLKKFTGEMQDSKQKTKCDGHQGETHPQIVTGLCFNPTVPLPPIVNSGKFLD